MSPEGGRVFPRMTVKENLLMGAYLPAARKHRETTLSKVYSLFPILAEKADDEGRISEIKIVDPRKGALTQIFEEFKPQGVPLVIETVVEQVDSLVQPVRGTGWQTSHPGDRTVRQELRLILKNSGLPPAGELFDRAYAYIRENY